MLGLVGCGGPPRIDRAPDAIEMDRLATLAATAPEAGWSARGRARIESQDGTVEGALTAVMDLPRRLRVEVSSRALFGMVGERVVVSLPGDEHILLYRAREETLEREPFATSSLAQRLPTGALEELHALVTGRPPWPGGRPPADLAARTRVIGRSSDGRQVRYRVQLPDSVSSFELEIQDSVLLRLVWSGRATGPCEVRYDGWRRWGEIEQPSRMRLRAPQEELEVEIRLDEVQARSDFAPTDFEVY